MEKEASEKCTYPAEGELVGRVALVTGAGRGIGRCIALTLAKMGAVVLVNYNGSRERALEVVEEIEKAGGQGEAIGCDVSDYEACGRMAEEIIQKYARLDILVNNAGISSRTSLYDYTVEEFSRIVDVNLTAVFVCSQAAARLMKEQGGGTIINASSMVGEYGQPSGCGYPATKFAVNGLTKSLARELAKDHIRVNAVAPGVTKTDMVAALPKEMVERISAGIPLGRPGEPVDVANAYLYLASDMASYVTGIVLRVDGAAMN